MPEGLMNLLEEVPSSKRDEALAAAVVDVASVGPHEESDVCLVFEALAAIQDDKQLVGLLGDSSVWFMFQKWYPEDTTAQGHWTTVDSRTKKYIKSVLDTLSEAEGEADRHPHIEELVRMASIYPKQVAPSLLTALQGLEDHKKLAVLLDTERLSYVLTRHGRGGQGAVDELYNRMDSIVATAAVSGAVPDSWEEEEEEQQQLLKWKAKRNTLSVSDVAAFTDHRCEKVAVLLGRGHQAKHNTSYSGFGKDFEEELFHKIQKEEQVCEMVLVNTGNFLQTMENCAKKGDEVHILNFSVDTTNLEGFENITRCDMDAVKVSTRDGKEVALTVFEVKSSSHAKTTAQGQAAMYAMVLEALIKQTKDPSGDLVVDDKVTAKLWLREGLVECDLSLATAGMKLAQEKLRNDDLWRDPKPKLDRDCTKCKFVERCRGEVEGTLAGITGELPDIEDLLGNKKASEFPLRDWTNLDIKNRHTVVGASRVKFPVEDTPVAFGYRTSKRLSSLAEKSHNTHEVIITDLMEPSKDPLVPDKISFAMYHKDELHEADSYAGVCKFLEGLRGSDFSSDAIQVYTLNEGTARLYGKRMRVKNPPVEEGTIPTFVSLESIVREMCVVPELYGGDHVIQHMKEEINKTAVEEEQQQEATYKDDAVLGGKLLQYLRSRADTHSQHLAKPPPRRDLMSVDENAIQKIADIVSDPAKPDPDNKAAAWLGYLHKRLAQEKLVDEKLRRQNGAWTILQCTKLETMKNSLEEGEEEEEDEQRRKSTTRQVVGLVSVGTKKRFVQSEDWELLSFEEAVNNEQGVLCDITKRPSVKQCYLNDDLFLELNRIPVFKKGTFWVLRRKGLPLSFVTKTVKNATDKKMLKRLFEAANPERCNQTPPQPTISASSMMASYSGCTLTCDQQELVKKACENRLTVSCGPPGSGKTTAACAAITHIKEQERDATVCVTSHNVIPIKQIIERLLVPAGHVDRFGQWIGGNGASCVVGMSLEAYSSLDREYTVVSDKRHNAPPKKKTLPDFFDVVVVDEASQVEGYCLTTLLTRLKDNGRLIILGDPLQLGVNRPLNWDLPKGIPDIAGSLLQSFLGPHLQYAKSYLGPHVVNQNQYLRSDKAIGELTRCLYGGPMPTVEKALTLQAEGKHTWSNLRLGARLRGLMTIEVENDKVAAWDVAKSLAKFISLNYGIEENKKQPKVHLISKTKSGDAISSGVESATIEGCQGMTTDVTVLSLERFKDDNSSYLGDLNFCKQSLMNVCFTRAARLAVVVLPSGYTPHPSIMQKEDCRNGFAHIQKFLEMTPVSNRFRVGGLF